MNTKEFDTHLERQIKRTRDTLKQKAGEYAHGCHLSNFKTASAFLKCTPERALLGMMIKQLVSIRDFVQALEDGNIKTVSSEDLPMWEEKISDSINYLHLLNAMIRRKL